MESNYDRLVDMVKSHLDDLYETEEQGERMGWPTDLEKEVGWKKP